MGKCSLLAKKGRISMPNNILRTYRFFEVQQMAFPLHKNWRCAFQVFNLKVGRLKKAATIW
jgi:hypothetical protein